MIKVSAFSFIHLCFLSLVFPQELDAKSTIFFLIYVYYDTMVGIDAAKAFGVTEF